MKQITQIGILEIPNNVDLSTSSLLRGDIGDQPGQNKDRGSAFINTKIHHQTIHGMGGSFSEIGGKAIQSLDHNSREQVCVKIFDNNLNYFRLPVGASDFALDAYTPNDNDGDFEMEKFSLDRDKQHLIPFMELCKKHCPQMAIHASPWSPPAWMKEPKDMCNGASFIDDPKYYTAYAKYICKYITEFKNLGFNIDRYCIQNEPDVNPKYPSCRLPNHQMAKVIEHLHTEMQSQNITSNIWAGTFRSVNEATGVDFVTNCSHVLPLIEGIGTQYTLMQSIQDIQAHAPNLKIMHTESNCFNGANTWEQAVVLFLNVLDYLNNGCDVYTYWNMILTQTCESGWGWKQNSLVTINDQKGDVTYNPDFYIMELVCKCIQKGFVRVSYHSKFKRGIAFKAPNGDIHFIISNFTDKTENSQVTVDGVAYFMELTPYSIQHFKIS